MSFTVFPCPILVGAITCSTGSIELGARRSNIDRHTEMYGCWLSFQMVTRPALSRCPPAVHLTRQPVGGTATPERASTASYGTSYPGREIFYTLREAQVLIDGWRQTYNQLRPHSPARVPPTGTRNHHARTRLACDPPNQPQHPKRGSHHGTQHKGLIYDRNHAAEVRLP